MLKKLIIILLLTLGINTELIFAQVIEQDSLALVALYDSTDGDNWRNKNNWKKGPISGWHGVKVSEGRVIVLSLTGNNLRGPIPPEIGKLEKLTRLYLQNNQLTEIPPEIGKLESLTFLWLYNNQLTGIPPEIGNMKKLTWVWLSGNQLTGEIPPEIGKLEKLTHLYIDNNNLTDLPDLSALTSLKYLIIQNNQFTFEDIEPNIDIISDEFTHAAPNPQFTYAPQDSVGKVQNRTVPLGSNLTISVSVGGANNKYQWKKEGSIIQGATNHSYTINSAGFNDVGSYTCEITNTVATDLTLYSRPIFVYIGPNVKR